MCMARVCPRRAPVVTSGSGRSPCQDLPMARIALHITGDDEADAVLSRDPLALLIGMVLDQQVTIEKAFSSPADLLHRLGPKGPLDAAAIAAMEPQELAP